MKIRGDFTAVATITTSFTLSISLRVGRSNDLGGVSDPEALKEAWLTEKRMLLDTIASLRELLQKASDEVSGT